jgi:hypothetical protein
MEGLDLDVLDGLSFGPYASTRSDSSHEVAWNMNVFAKRINEAKP